MDCLLLDRFKIFHKRLPPPLRESRLLAPTPGPQLSDTSVRSTPHSLTWVLETFSVKLRWGASSASSSTGKEATSDFLILLVHVLGTLFLPEECTVSEPDILQNSKLHRGTRSRIKTSPYLIGGRVHSRFRVLVWSIQFLLRNKVTLPRLPRTD